jgi:hypothetical protein
MRRMTLLFTAMALMLGSSTALAGGVRGGLQQGQRPHRNPMSDIIHAVVSRDLNSSGTLVASA